MEIAIILRYKTGSRFTWSIKTSIPAVNRLNMYRLYAYTAFFTIARIGTQVAQCIVLICVQSFH